MYCSNLFLSLTLKKMLKKVKIKLWIPILFSFTSFCYYRKHPNNDNKICTLPCSASFQEHFNVWFSVTGYNSDLGRLEWMPLLFSSSYLSNRRKLFFIPVTEYAFFSHQATTFKTDLLKFNYIKTGLLLLIFLSSHVFFIFWYPVLKNNHATWP